MRARQEERRARGVILGGGKKKKRLRSAAAASGPQKGQRMEEKEIVNVFSSNDNAVGGRKGPWRKDGARGVAGPAATRAAPKGRRIQGLHRRDQGSVPPAGADRSAAFLLSGEAKTGRAPINWEARAGAASFVINLPGAGADGGGGARSATAHTTAGGHPPRFR